MSLQSDLGLSPQPFSKGLRARHFVIENPVALKMLDPNGTYEINAVYNINNTITVLAHSRMNVNRSAGNLISRTKATGATYQSWQALVQSSINGAITTDMTYPNPSVAAVLFTGKKTSGTRFDGRLLGPVWETFSGETFGEYLWKNCRCTHPAVVATIKQLSNERLLIDPCVMTP